MKTGEAVTDTQGTTWTVGQELGRGAYARTYVARSADGREAVLKLSLSSDDLPGAPELVAACAKIVQEQSDWMRDRKYGWLPDLIDGFSTPTGLRGHLTPRQSATLASRVRSGAPLAGLLEALTQAADAVSSSVHGNLRAENILLLDDGSVRLSDPLTPTWQAQFGALKSRASARPSVRPTEVTDDSAPKAGWDTFALCIVLYQAAALAAPGTDGRRDDPPALPKAGLDKVALSAVKDRVHARLQVERANPRFASRVSDKLGAVLNRGLSREPAPSPPYRFNQTRDLHTRLAEVYNLIDPSVVNVGRVLLAAHAKDNMFEGGDSAKFSTTVTVTPGASHEDLATGLLVRDLDAEGDDRVPVPECRYAVKPHASGRLRFDFELPELRPGRYTVRVAFTLKDSGHEPQTTDGHFEIRPPPGYVPPADEAPAENAALRFPGSGSGALAAGSDMLDEPVLDVEPPAFPSPIAPSDPGMLQGLDGLLDDDEDVLPGLSPVPSVSGGMSGVRPSAADGPRLGIAPSVTSAPSPHAVASPHSTAVPLSDPGTRPSVPGAQTGTAHAVPGLNPTPSLAPSTEPAPVMSSATPMSVPAWGAGRDTWANLPGLDDPASAGDNLLPTPGDFSAGSSHGMQDLPGLDDPDSNGSLGAFMDSVVTLIRENATIALVVVMLLVIGLLLIAGLVFNALAG